MVRHYAAKEKFRVGSDENGAHTDTHLVLQCKTPVYRSDSHSGIGRTRPGLGYICKVHMKEESTG